MADVPSPDLIRNPVGGPFDDPATPDQLGAGPDGGASLFALLKGILLALWALQQSQSGE